MPIMKEVKTFLDVSLVYTIELRLLQVVIYEALCFDVAQSQMNGHPMRLELTRVGC